MKENSAPLDVDALLAHSEWVRALARHLLDDEHLADDVAQETWLAAIRKPPRAALTPWLKVVAQNISRKAKRQRARRVARERHAAQPELQTRRFQAHRTVVQAVEELAEPYRTSVILRYFEDLPPRAIAERMDVPVATVRTRLHRALDLLRGRLDRDCGGDGSAWALALAPLLSPSAPASPIAGVATGVAVMAKKTVTALVVLVAALSLLWLVTRDDSPGDPGRATTRNTARLPAAAPRRTASKPTESAPPRLAPGLNFLRARVQAPGGTGLRGMRVELVRTALLGQHIKKDRRIEATPQVVARATSTHDGLVEFKQPPPDWTGTLHYRAVGRGWRSGDVSVRHTDTTVIVCRPTRTVEVRTRDSDGPTQATLLVASVDYSNRTRNVLERLRTSEDGLLAFEALPGEQLEVFALNEEGCSSPWGGIVPATGLLHRIELLLSHNALQARLMFGADPVVGAEAWLDGLRVDRNASATDGRIALLPIPPFRLSDVEFRFPWLYHPLLTESIEQEPGGARLIQLTGFVMSRPGDVRVLSPAGAPIKGALVGLQRHVGFQAVGQVATDDRGRALVHARRRFGSQKGRDIVWRYATEAIVYAEDYAPRLVEIPDGESEVALDRVAHRLVHVVDKTGAPVPHARLHLRHRPDGDQVGYGITLLADARGRCRVPALPNWTVRARVFGGGVYIRQSKAAPVGTEPTPLRLEIDAPSPFPLAVVLRNADASAVSEPVHLQIDSNGGQSRDVVLVEGTWSEIAIWRGYFRIRARGLRSGLVAAANLQLSPEAPRHQPLELTLSAPWIVRVRPLGIPYDADFRPWRARGYVGQRATWQSLSVRERDGLLEIHLPSAGPWTLEISHGKSQATISQIPAVRATNAPPHDISFAQLARLALDLGDHVRGRPSLMLLPLRPDGTPAAAKPTHKKGLWAGTSATWQLPQGNYQFALVDGKPGEKMWLWATSKATKLLAGQETRLQLAPRSIAILSILPPGDSRIDWGSLTLRPEDSALAWLAEAVNLRVRVTPDGPKAPLWPGSFALLNPEGRIVYRLIVRTGDQEAALVPVD